jgi:hypothetical protein
MKTNFLHKLTVERSGKSSGQMAPTLRKGETKQIEAAWKGELRISGFHEFCASKEVQSKLPALFLIREQERRAEAEKNGIDYQPERQVNAHHAVKSSLWRDLSKEERDEWTELAQNSAEKHHLSKDRCVLVSLYMTIKLMLLTRPTAMLMAEKAVIRALFHVLAPLNVYGALYLGYELEGHPKTVL